MVRCDMCQGTEQAVSSPFSCCINMAGLEKSGVRSAAIDRVEMSMYCKTAVELLADYGKECPAMQVPVAGLSILLIFCQRSCYRDGPVVPECVRVVQQRREHILYRVAGSLLPAASVAGFLVVGLAPSRGSSLTAMSFVDHTKTLLPVRIVIRIW